MNANETILLKDEVYLVVGCALEVINGIGHGLHELQRTIIQQLQPRSLFRIRVYSRPFAVTFMASSGSHALRFNVAFWRLTLPRVIAELCKTLTDTETNFSTPSLRLVYRQVGSA